MSWGFLTTLLMPFLICSKSGFNRWHWRQNRRVWSVRDISGSCRTGCRPSNHGIPGPRFVVSLKAGLAYFRSVGLGVEEGFVVLLLYIGQCRESSWLVAKINRCMLGAVIWVHV